MQNHDKYGKLLEQYQARKPIMVLIGFIAFSLVSVGAGIALQFADIEFTGEDAFLNTLMPIILFGSPVLFIGLGIVFMKLKRPVQYLYERGAVLDMGVRGVPPIEFGIEDIKGVQYSVLGNGEKPKLFYVYLTDELTAKINSSYANKFATLVNKSDYLDLAKFSEGLPWSFCGALLNLNTERHIKNLTKDNIKDARFTFHAPPNAALGSLLETMTRMSADYSLVLENGVFIYSEKDKKVALPLSEVAQVTREIKLWDSTYKVHLKSVDEQGKTTREISMGVWEVWNIDVLYYIVDTFGAGAE